MIQDDVMPRKIRGHALDIRDLFVLYHMEKVKSYGDRFPPKVIDFKWSHIDQFNLDLLKMGS